MTNTNSLGLYDIALRECVAHSMFVKSISLLPDNPTIRRLAMIELRGYEDRAQAAVANLTDEARDSVLETAAKMVGV